MGLISWIVNLFKSDNKTSVGGVSQSPQLEDSLKMFLGNRPEIKSADTEYAHVKKSWLLYPWYNYFCKVLNGLKIGGWKEDFDCDNFARLYVSLIQACHAKANTKTEGIAVGEFWYSPDSGDGHAIIVALTDEGWTFVEPQSGKELCLTDSERQSCFFVYF